MLTTTNCPRIHSFPHPTHSGWSTSPQMLGCPFGWGVSTTVQTMVCPQHTTVLTGNNSPNYFLALTPHPHQPARNACCPMTPALVLSAQTRHTSRVSDSCFVRLLRTQTIHVHKPYPLLQSAPQPPRLQSILIAAYHFTPTIPLQIYRIT